MFLALTSEEGRAFILDLSQRRLPTRDAKGEIFYAALRFRHADNNITATPFARMNAVALQAGSRFDVFVAGIG